MFDSNFTKKISLNKQKAINFYNLFLNIKDFFVSFIVVLKRKRKKLGAKVINMKKI